MLDFGYVFIAGVVTIVLCALVGHWLTLRHTRQKLKMKQRHETEKLMYEQEDEDDA